MDFYGTENMDIDHYEDEICQEAEEYRDQIKYNMGILTRNMKGRTGNPMINLVSTWTQILSWLTLPHWTTGGQGSAPGSTSTPSHSATYNLSYLDYRLGNRTSDPHSPKASDRHNAENKINNPDNSSGQSDNLPGLLQFLPSDKMTHMVSKQGLTP